MARTEPVLSKAISATSDGANEIVAAVTAKKIRVVGYVLNVNAAGTVQWKSATTALSGAMEFVDGGGMVAPLCDPAAAFWFETAAGEALNITNSAGLDSLGHLAYQVI
jgi:hypothetical protein